MTDDDAGGGGKNGDSWTKLFVNDPLLSNINIIFALTIALFCARGVVSRISEMLVCKIPLLARRTRPAGQARCATIGYLVCKWGSIFG